MPSSATGRRSRSGTRTCVSQFRAGTAPSDCSRMRSPPPSVTRSERSDAQSSLRLVKPESAGAGRRMVLVPKDAAVSAGSRVATVTSGSSRARWRSRSRPSSIASSPRLFSPNQPIARTRRRRDTRRGYRRRPLDCARGQHQVAPGTVARARTQARAQCGNCRTPAAPRRPCPCLVAGPGPLADLAHRRAQRCSMKQSRAVTGRPPGWCSRTRLG